MNKNLRRVILVILLTMAAVLFYFMVNFYIQNTGSANRITIQHNAIQDMPADHYIVGTTLV